MDHLEAGVFAYLVFLTSLGNFLEVNVARGKPTFASSVLLYYGTFAYPSYVVDGNYTTEFAVHMCFHGDDGPGGPNWWSVDLKQIVWIDRVVLTNRGDFDTCTRYPSCSSRLDYFIVGLTNVTPSLETVVRDKYPQCGTYPGTVPPATNVTLICGARTPPGRYLIVQQPLSGPGALTLCEIEVWPKRTRSNWKRHDGVKLLNNGIGATFVGTALDCMIRCQEMRNECYSFNHCPHDSSCQMNSHPKGVSQSDVSTSFGCNWWQPQYD